jgi:O-antigen biosynthesis protein
MSALNRSPDSAFCTVLLHGAAPSEEWLNQLTKNAGSPIKVRLITSSNQATQTRPIITLPREQTLWLAAVRAQIELDDVLILRTTIEMPNDWLVRLRMLTSGASNIDVLSFFCNNDPAFSPVPEGEVWTSHVDAAALDRWCQKLGNIAFWPSTQANLACTYLLGNRRGAELYAFSEQLFAFDTSGAMSGLTLPPDSRENPPASVLLATQELLAKHLRKKPPTPSAAIKPRVLHVLHDWGGGIARFASDLANADSLHEHWFLISVGHHSRQQFGEYLELRYAPEADAAVRRFQLLPAISSVASTHAQYAEILRSILTDYAIAGVIISSLIGHSLDALRSALPTLVVHHDYFPLWPELHVDFGDLASNFTPAELQARFLNKVIAKPFASQPAATWNALRREFVQALLAKNITRVAPSQSVASNIARMEPELAEANVHIIAHGLDMPATTISAPTVSNRLTVLVLGRINDGKGHALLQKIIPSCSDIAHFHLLGAGSASLNYFGTTQVDIELNYSLAELTGRVEKIKPDLALFAATVSESFSYTLSECWRMRLPVVATALGSFKERISDGENGWLVAPHATAVREKLLQLRNQPAQLVKMRAILASMPNRECAAMVADYARIWQVNPITPANARLASWPQCENARMAADAIRIAHTQDKIEAQKHQLEVELGKRSEWAFAQQKLANERTQWARSLQEDLRHAANLTSSLEQQIKTLDNELLEASSRLAQSHSAFEALEHKLADSNSALAEIRNSTIWRASAPVRRTIENLRNTLSPLSYRLRRAVSLFARGVHSLRVRGLVGTWERLFAHTHATPTTALELPLVPVMFESFAVNTNESPTVSIIIPIHNKFHYTHRCLLSLASATEKTSFEVIVVDDCSSDESAENLKLIHGIRLLRNATNLGFIGACNVGAAGARGEYLFFLNNDTVVQHGFLDEIISTFERQADAGLIGAKLVYPDGRLQESGGIVFADGSGWNYGRFADPADPHFNFLREVDYVSGAAIMLRKKLFEEFGGFDQLYTPAYYEDTDLAFKVRQHRLKVYVQPAATVVHFEGISSGTDLTTGIKRFQVINQEKFVARWRDVLATHPMPPPALPIEIACEHRLRGRILVVDACTPMPDQDSGSVRMRHLLLLLIELGYRPTFIAENRAHHIGYAEALQREGVEVLFHPYIKAFPAFLREHGAHFDFVILSRHYVAAPLFDLVRQNCPRAKIIFDTVDLHYLRERREANLQHDAKLAAHAEATRRKEHSLIRRADLTWVVSPIEQTLLLEEIPGARVAVLTNIHPIFGCRQPFSFRQDLLFVGGFQHPPNVDAVRWFCHDVMPYLRTKNVAIRLHVVGSKTPQDIAALAGDDIVIHGFVENLEPLLDRSLISIAPLRYGAGVKGKVNLAMSYGLPVVATTAAVEGMYVEDGRDALVADAASDFADAIIRLASDPILWQRLSDGGLRNVQTHFSLDAARNALRNSLNL